MAKIRPDLVLNAKDGDGALYVQVDTNLDPVANVDFTYTKFTMVWSHPKGASPIGVLKDLAEFILTRK